MFSNRAGIGFKRLEAPWMVEVETTKERLVDFLSGKPHQCFSEGTDKYSYSYVREGDAIAARDRMIAAGLKATVGRR